MIVISFFRNASANGQVQRFMARVARLPDVSRLVAVHGDSTDDTPSALERWAGEYGVNVQLVERSHGGPVWGSVEDAKRLQALSYVGDGALEAITPEDHDSIFYVESDLIWNEHVVALLFAHLHRGRGDIIAPMIYCGDRFYDTFVFRKDGKRFTGHAPFHAALAGDAWRRDRLLPSKGRLLDVDSVGSAFVMHPQVARDCRMANGQALLGFCADARAKGYRIVVDTSLRVDHPANDLFRRPR